MPTPPITDEQCRAGLAAWRRHNRSHDAAAAELGVAKSTLWRWVTEGRRRGLDALAIDPAQHISPADVLLKREPLPGEPKPTNETLITRNLPKYRVLAPPAGVLRVLAMGDSHDDPRIKDKSRFALMGRLAAAERPDVILHIGDFLEMASLCFHTRDDTYKGRSKPTFAQDIESGAEAMAAFEAELPGDYRPRKHITLGNHEDRAWRYEDSHPATVGQLTGQIETLFESHGWTHQRFGHWSMIGGVGFTHVPRSIMARPLGGKNVENTVANESTFAVVFGHTHRFNHITRAKQGYNNSLTVTNLGSTMPPGYVADFAEGLPTGITYGPVMLTIFDGIVQSAAMIPFRELELRFRRRAA